MLSFDALLVVGFGGPEAREDVLPFLENVTRGRGVPRERLLGVAEHYYHFDGRSPINSQVRALVEALAAVLPIPVYWGNRNWHPMLADTVRQMKADGVRNAVALATSAFSSYSACRQYLENIADARAEVGDGAPVIEKIPPYWNHPGFLTAMADRVREALGTLNVTDPEIIFTAHSIPASMASTSRYEPQLREASRLIAEQCGLADSWTLAWQSRSGPPTQPWLEPDINDYLRARPNPARPTVIAPVGFLSDHIEVLWDLDHEARETCAELGTPMIRAGTVGLHPAFIAGLRELVLSPFTACAEGCCPRPQPPRAAPAAGAPSRG